MRNLSTTLAKLAAAGLHVCAHWPEPRLGLVADASECDADNSISPARRCVRWPLWAHVMPVMVQPLDLRAGRLHGVRSWHRLHSPAATVTAVTATLATRATPWTRWLQVYLRGLH